MVPHGKCKSVLVVGSGLAGLTASIKLVEKGCNVTIIEKTRNFGGNSVKASSGINGVPTKYQSGNKDSVVSFIDDTMRSGGGLSSPRLVEILADGSKDAIEWLTENNSIDLSLVAQLGGHSFARTHRGSGALPPGYAIVSALVRKLEHLQETTNRLTILKNASLTRLFTGFDNKVSGVEYRMNDHLYTLNSENVVLATGGFSADFDTDDSLIAKYRPDLLNLPSTNGKQSTGDGQKIAARDVGANLIHMNKVQIHPTGFINISDARSMEDKWKILCGEVLRGIGGILISPISGSRFTNELDTRERVTEAIFSNCELQSKSNLKMEPGTAIALILISPKDYNKAKMHIDFYVKQGLLMNGTVSDVIRTIKQLNPTSDTSVDKFENELQNYNKCINSGIDNFGRTTFGAGFEDANTLYYGLVTPVIHFTMGGLEVNENCQVINKSGKPIENLYAIGEVSGGLHGRNRLGGSSLLECVVFGTLVSQKIIN